MKKLAIVFSILSVLFVITPSVSFAATLTQPQVDSIINLLIAFGVDQNTISIVQADLTPPVATTTDSTSTPVIVAPILQSPLIPQQPSAPVAQASIPIPSCLMSTTTEVTPQDPFGRDRVTWSENGILSNSSYGVIIETNKYSVQDFTNRVLDQSNGTCRYGEFAPYCIDIGRNTAGSFVISPETHSDKYDFTGIFASANGQVATCSASF